MKELPIDIIEKCKSSNDGIYAYFCDHLSMDANKIFVVQNHEIVMPSDDCLEELHLASEWRKKDVIWAKGVMEILIDSDSDYYGTIGFTHALQILKRYYPDLKTYYCNVGWFTFPKEWMEITEDRYYAKRCDEMFEVIHFEHKSVNEDLDFVLDK